MNGSSFAARPFGHAAKKFRTARFNHIVINQRCQPVFKNRLVASASAPVSGGSHGRLWSMGKMLRMNLRHNSALDRLRLAIAGLTHLETVRLALDSPHPISADDYIISGQ